MSFFKHGPHIAWGLIAGVLLVFGLSTLLLAETAQVRYERDVTRMVFNDNLDVLESIRQQVGAVTDTLEAELASAPATPGERPYLVVSVSDNLVWYKQGDSVLFQAQVATGSGKELVNTGSGEVWRFETPRGRLVVLEKEENPAWIPPDWHFVEAARNRGLGVVRMNRNEIIPLEDGAILEVQGSDIVRRYPDGRVEAHAPGEDGREIVANGSIVIPPFGTNQRKYDGVLGTRRLKLGDGYALHGTNRPETVGQSVSHGCIRLRNEDIEALYGMVPVGTPVYIY